jgi:hypothetical protein
MSGRWTAAGDGLFLAVTGPMDASACISGGPPVWVTEATRAVRDARGVQLLAADGTVLGELTR